MNRLYRIYKERLKFYILILLLITSVIQLGILWNYQNQGLPFDFLHLSGSKRTIADNTQVSRNFFTPFKVIISQGTEDSRWILNKNDSNYDKLWAEAKYYLKSVFKTKSNNTYADIKDWYNLIDKRTFIFEFKTNIKVNLLKDFLSISKTPPDTPSGVYKMIISPWEDITNFNSNTIYIYDGIKIYKYNLLLNPNRFDKNQYDKIITDLSNKSNMKAYSFLKQAVSGILRGFRDDLMVVISGNKYIKYNDVASSLPLGFGSREPDPNKVASKILGSQKDNYYYNSDKTIELWTLNNKYKIYSNGFMEYKYTTAQSASDKGELKDAFKNACEFVNGLGLKTDNTSLFLSGYKEDNDFFYEFEFDYLVSDKTNDVPIYMDYTYKNDYGKTLKSHHAIIIKANSKNVLSCIAMIKTFKFTGEATQYNINLIYATYFKNPNLSIDKNATGKDVFVSYKMGNEEESKELEMVWVIKAGDNFYTSPMIND